MLLAVVWGAYHVGSWRIGVGNVGIPERADLGPSSPDFEPAANRLLAMDAAKCRHARRATAPRAIEETWKLASSSQPSAH